MSLEYKRTALALQIAQINIEVMRLDLPELRDMAAAGMIGAGAVRSRDEVIVKLVDLERLLLARLQAMGGQAKPQATGMQAIIESLQAGGFQRDKNGVVSHIDHGDFPSWEAAAISCIQVAAY